LSCGGDFLEKTKAKKAQLRMGSNATKTRAGVPALGGALSSLQEAEPALVRYFFLFTRT
jgi:hypothetical protein